MNQATIEYLKSLASRETIYEKHKNPVIDDFAGGNVDDAFYLGRHTEEVYLARKILDMEGITYAIG